MFTQSARWPHVFRFNRPAPTYRQVNCSRKRFAQLSKFSGWWLDCWKTAKKEEVWHRRDAIDWVFVVFAEDGELRRTLQSLACGKARVLIKKPKVRKTRWLSLSFMYPESLKWVLDFHLSQLWFKQISHLPVNFADLRSWLSGKKRVILFLSWHWTVSLILSEQLKPIQALYPH